MSTLERSRRRAAPQRYSSATSQQRVRYNKPAAKRGPKKQYIHPSKFIRAAKLSTAEVYVPTNTFEDFAVHPLIHRNLEAKGYKTPSPIQDQAIPMALNGADIVGIAHTGTGKTAAFAVPLLNALLKDPSSVALIVAPTRELAQQIEDECRSIAKSSGIFGVLLIGGAPMGPQLRDLRMNPRVVIGTPGRIKDHLSRGTLNLAKCNIIVLDEVDRMLDMGFVNDVRDILSNVAEDRQSLFFSATLDARVEDLISTFAPEAVKVSVKTGDTTDSVHQDIVCYIGADDKMLQLHDLLIKPEVSKAIVFDDTQRSVERLAKELMSRGFKADSIHGGKSQAQRQRALKRFKDDEITILVATDVAARGIDVADISHVINYSLPQSYDDYIHRIGRAGRADKIGNALTFVTT